MLVMGQRYSVVSVGTQSSVVMNMVPFVGLSVRQFDRVSVYMKKSSGGWVSFTHRHS